MILLFTKRCFPRFSINPMAHFYSILLMVLHVYKVYSGLKILGSSDIIVEQHVFLDN